MTNATPAPTGGAIASMEGVTTTTLILIAIGAVVVILLMTWGARLKHRRKAADRELREQAGTTVASGTITDAAARPPATDAGSVPDPSSTAATPGAAPARSDAEERAAPIEPAARDVPAAAAPSDVERQAGPTSPVVPDTPTPAVSNDAEERPAPSAPVVHDAPVTPAPPPLAGDSTPVVAAAPFDATPASVAADLATPPADPQGSSDSDDLTVMKGVGPRLAVRLGELGVSRYADLAGLTPEQADALDAQLGSFRGRLTRDRWIEQAGYLARGDRAGFEAAFGKL